jgi:hypothetical protein
MPCSSEKTFSGLYGVTIQKTIFFSRKQTVSYKYIGTCVMKTLTARSTTYESSVSMGHAIQSCTAISKFYTMMKHKNLVRAEKVTVDFKRPEKVSILSTRMSFVFS